uniref:C-C motif chemokine n=1 Tax=Chelydra serpentina TaxID=8475 RepID=A0A8C3RVT0_CHESE
ISIIQMCIMCPILLTVNGVFPLVLVVKTKSHTPVECCFDYVTGAIQLVKLVDFYTTPSECHLPAVVFKTRADRLVCADPSKLWVKRAMKVLEAKRKQTSLSENHR